MTDSVMIGNPNLKRIVINDDESKVLEFDPTDALFVERFYRLLEALKSKLKEYEQAKVTMSADKEVDELGISTNVGKQIEVLKDACHFIRGQIDNLFGEGTAQMIFGDSMSLDYFKQFFVKLTPFVQQVRAEKLDQFIVPSAKGKKRSRK